MPVRCYFPEQDEPHWGEVVEYDAEPEYYVVSVYDETFRLSMWACQVSAANSQA